MKRLLVSVRDAAEARIVLDCGVDLIDIKEPNQGALGAADPSVWREVLGCLEGRVPVSCALGELASAAQAAEHVPDGMAFIKVGLARAAASDDWRDRWARLLATRPAGCAAAAVVYADWQTAAAPAPSQVLKHALRLGCTALLVDTFDKRHGHVFDHWPTAALNVFLSEAAHTGLTTLLGGGLTWDALATAMDTPADYLAVRGLACGGHRTDGIDSNACRQLAERIHTNSQH